MARMASRPRIGLIIRRGMERKRLNQTQVAEALGVSRSAVNAWVHDRMWPLNSIAALEDLLGISIPRTLEEQRAFDRTAQPPPPPAFHPPPADPRERELWNLLTGDQVPPGKRMEPGEAWEMIELYRRRRRRTA